MILKASDADVLEMGKLAVLASRPVGMDFLQHNPNLKKEDIDLGPIDDGLYIDYYAGRMVKFGARKTAKGWSFADNISSAYQSWISKYPSYQALYEAATAKVAA